MQIHILLGLLCIGRQLKGKSKSLNYLLKAAERKKEIVELLIEKGADVNAKDQKGKTPLDTAYGQTADLLRKHGAKTSEELDAAGKQTNSLHHLNA